MTIKKAMILAAGFGKRMLPLTEHTPKSLIKIGPKNLLERSIELLIKIGINELVINTHYLSDKIDSFLESRNYGISISIVKENELLDTGGGVLNATKKFENSPFFILNPDTIWNKNYYEELKILENSYLDNNKSILLIVDKNISYDKSFTGDFNFTNNNYLIRENNNQYIFTGAQIVNRSIFKGIEKKKFLYEFSMGSTFKRKKITRTRKQSNFFPRK